MSGLPLALKTACIDGEYQIVVDLFDQLMKAEPTSRHTTLSEMAVLSAQNKRLEILEFCFHAGFKMDPERINDPLLYAACDTGSVELFNALILNGMDVDIYSELNGSPLTAACYKGNVDLVRFLLENGANPNIGYPLGRYEALVWSIVGDNASTKVVDLLLKHGVKVKGSGAVTAAAEHGNMSALQLLLEQEKAMEGGQDLEEVENYGEEDPRALDDQGTPLYKAAATGHVDVVELLIKEGASTDFRDRKGRSILDVAVENGHREVADMIKEHAS